MQYTTNYNLKKPATTDFYDIGDHNDNMDAIDATMKSISDDVTSQGTTLQTLNGKITGNGKLEDKVGDLCDGLDYDPTDGNLGALNEIDSRLDALEGGRGIDTGWQTEMASNGNEMTYRFISSGKIGTLWMFGEFKAASTDPFCNDISVSLPTVIKESIPSIAGAYKAYWQETVNNQVVQLHATCGNGTMEIFKDTYIGPDGDGNNFITQVALEIPIITA